MSIQDELKAIHRQRRQERLNENARLHELNTQVPYHELPVRNIEARAAIAALKGLPLEDQIKGVMSIPYYKILGAGIENFEINAILEYLGSPIRAIYRHGCSSPVQLPSDWGWYHVDHAESTYDNPNPVHICPMPRSTDAISFLLNRSA